jgi:hypothetical protein
MSCRRAGGAVEDNLETIATGVKQFYDQQVSQAR